MSGVNRCAYSCRLVTGSPKTMLMPGANGATHSFVTANRRVCCYVCLCSQELWLVHYNTSGDRKQESVE